MKIYCKECSKKNKVSATECKHCGHEIVPNLKDEKEIRPFVQKLHKKTNILRHYISHSLSSLVIGLILLVIAFFFYYLAFSSSIDKETGEKIYILNTACSEFWVSMVCLIIGGAAFLAGLVISLVIYRQKRQTLYDIDQIRETGSLQTRAVDLLVVIWFRKIVSSIKHLKWVIQYKKSQKNNKEVK